MLSFERAIAIFQSMYHHGIGAQHAKFYSAWADQLENFDKFSEANKVWEFAEQKEAKPESFLKTMRKYVAVNTLLIFNFRVIYLCN